MDDPKLRVAFGVLCWRCNTARYRASDDGGPSRVPPVSGIARKRFCKIGKVDQASGSIGIREQYNEVHCSRAKKWRRSDLSSVFGRPGGRNSIALGHQFHEPAQSVFSRKLATD